MNDTDWGPEQRRAWQKNLVLQSAPRLLSALNRCPVSASSGSFDREYWAWCVKDFANYDLQRATAVLAWLYTTPFEGNRFYGRPAMLAWVRQAIAFWLRGQERGGAFDHLYPLEKSWMAAAFTLVDMTAAWDMLHEELPPAFQAEWLAGMKRAAACLETRDEDHGFISNHRAGAAAGLLAFFRISGERGARDAALRLLNGILAHQSADGFFQEYEGADPGYETLGLHYLAKAHRELALAGLEPLRQRLEAAVGRSLEFLSYFVHPGGSVGGEYGSRGCPHVFLGGLEYWSAIFPLAEAICRRTTPALQQNRAAGVADSDFRNEIPLLSSAIFAAATDAEPRFFEPTTLPCERAFERYFPEAGIYVRSEPAKAFIIVGASKGGVVKAFDSRSLVYSNDGYVAARKRRHYTTHIWHRPEISGAPAPGEQPVRESAELTLRMPFFRFKPAREMTVPGMMAFRLFNYTFGRWQKLNGLARRLIIRLFLTQKSGTSAFIERKVSFDGGTLRISDTAHGCQGFDSLSRHGFFATVYMASARYFRTDDFGQVWSEDLVPPTRPEEDLPPSVVEFAGEDA